MTEPLRDVDPLAPLLLRRHEPAVGLVVRYRTGRVTAWTATTGENTITVDGVALTNLPMLPGPYMALVEAGDLVSLTSTSDDAGIATLIVTGIILTPPDPRAAILSATSRPPYCRLVQTAVQTSLNFANMTNLDPVIDTDGMASGDTIVIQTRGVYLLSAATFIALGTGGAGSREVSVRVDTPSMFERDINIASGYLPASPTLTSGISLNAHLCVPMDVGDLVRSKLSAPTGSLTSAAETWLQAIYVGDLQ